MKNNDGNSCKQGNKRHVAHTVGQPVESNPYQGWLWQGDSQSQSDGNKLLGEVLTPNLTITQGGGSSQLNRYDGLIEVLAYNSIDMMI